MGGHALRNTRRRLVLAVVGALLPLLGGCAGRGYRDHRVPAFVAPGPARYAEGTHPVRLRARDSVLLDGGIRLVLPDRARFVPDFAFRDEMGVLHTPDTLRGRVVWVDLWAVWCATCRAEFPFVEKLQQRFADNGLTVLAVCRNSTREGFVQATRKDWIHFPVIDANDERDFPLPYRAFPTSALIDRHGRVRAYWQGHRSPAALEEAVRYLLAESPPLLAAASVPGRMEASVEEAPPALPTSSNVLRAKLDLADDLLPPGGYFEGVVTLDVDPGWFLSAERDEGAVPLRIRFGESSAFPVLDCRLPRPVPVETSTGPRAGHAGRLELPVWGLLASDLLPGHPVDLEIVATVQACDRTQCLPPTDLVLASRLWVADEEGTER